MFVMTETIKVLKRYESFVLGFCRCGCGIEFTNIRMGDYLKKYIRNHRAGGEKHWNWNGGKKIHIAGYVLILKLDHHKASKYSTFQNMFRY